MFHLSNLCLAAAGDATTLEAEALLSFISKLSAAVITLVSTVINPQDFQASFCGVMIFEKGKTDACGKTYRERMEG